MSEQGGTTNYCLESVLFAAMFSIKGAAPPPSKKLTDRPEFSPVLVDANAPVKYRARFTSVPLTIPGAKMPGTLMPTLGLVSIFLHQFSHTFHMGERRGWGGGQKNIQFPITAVFTTSVRRVIWFAAVLFLRSAVVYQSQMEMFEGRS